MSAPRTARERARLELTSEIKETARRHLAREGAAGLSLRAVARDLGMSSSALYRYFASRDDLLTALIIDSYNAIGEVAEKADAKAVKTGASAGGRWLAVCRAVRRWALSHRHEWALVYGTPVPGYAAPQDTIQPATRVQRVLIRILLGGLASGEIGAPETPLPGPRLLSEQAVETAGALPDPPNDDMGERVLTLWSALIGSVSLEVFGQYTDVLTDNDRFADLNVALVASTAGLHVPIDTP